MQALRARLLFVGLALATIGLGLATYYAGNALSPTARDVCADALWAMMIVWWVGAIIPNYKPNVRAVVSLAICWAVEFSQLYHAPAVDKLRSTTLGHLVLGSDFDARDLASYAIGVGIALCLEYFICRSRSEHEDQ